MGNLTALNNVNQLTETTLGHLDNFRDILKIHLRAVTDQRKLHPKGKPHTISNDAIGILYKKCEVLRDCGEVINFNVFSCAIDQIEKLLNKLQTPIQYRRTDTLGDLMTVIDNLEHSLKK